MTNTTTPDELRSSRIFQIEFAELAFRNNQDLVRFIDQKASLMITAVGVLTAAIGTLLIRALSVPAEELWQVFVRLVVCVIVLAYMLMAFLVITAAARVLAPSTKPLRTDSQSLALLFPLALLARSQDDEEQYFARLSNATPEDLLRDYANQIVEIANVYRGKQRQLGIAIGHFRTLSVLWVVTILMLGAVVGLVA